MLPGQPLELTPVAIQIGQLLAKRLFSDSTIKVRLEQDLIFQFNFVYLDELL
jgi:hypothetical protein